MAATVLVDYPNRIEEYRKKILIAEEKLVSQLGQIEEVFGDDLCPDEIKIKYIEAISTSIKLQSVISEYDKALAEYQQRIEQLENTCMII